MQRVQKMANVSVQIVEDDFPTVREVDLKLIELAKVYEGKIITNDFNLNKVAQLQGVEVLNINELAKWRFRSQLCCRAKPCASSS